MLINTIEDLQAATSSQEQSAFLTGLLNDYVTFDDAVYPEGYDRTLQEGDEGLCRACDPPGMERWCCRSLGVCEPQGNRANFGLSPEVLMQVCRGSKKQDRHRSH
jgi:hypothetical protein